MNTISEELIRWQQDAIFKSGSYTTQVNAYLGHRQWQAFSEEVLRDHGLRQPDSAYKRGGEIAFNGMKVFRVIADSHFHVCRVDD